MIFLLLALFLGLLLAVLYRFLLLRLAIPVMGTYLFIYLLLLPLRLGITVMVEWALKSS